MGLELEHLAVQHAPPVAAKVEALTNHRLEVVPHQPLLDQVRFSERAPDFFRRMRKLAFNNHRAGVTHWSILLSKSSRSSNRPFQKRVIWCAQPISGASALTSAL